ncbi:hypothetical protein R5R35_000456 [Gryllus longicercus]|uniref:Lipocalin/cytosolic fatty-acid binding domain-containing protein n=1 Tax=Gryllus longicercus TaxID=2509291 RepID=A0AAN9VGH0_9ORTH|nr:Uncharacterized protein GBIM_06346 [Gryllus bimaculatus]
MGKILHMFTVLNVMCIAIGMPLSNNMTACPSTPAQRNINIDELVGKWYLASLLFHEPVENVNVIEEEAACMKTDFTKVNSTFMSQVWAIHSPTRNTRMVFELPTVLDHPGSWIVTSPLGVPFHVTVIQVLPRSHMVLVFCAGENTLQYLWTAILTRKTKLTRFDTMLSSIITGYGFDFTEQLPIWHYCLPAATQD